MKKETHDIPLLDRLALTPTQFARLFGKHYTWGYRQIYKGNRVAREVTLPSSHTTGHTDPYHGGS